MNVKGYCFDCGGYHNPPAENADKVYGTEARRKGRPTYSQMLGDVKTISSELGESPKQTGAYEKLGPKRLSQVIPRKNVQLMDADAASAVDPDPTQDDNRELY